MTHGFWARCRRSRADATAAQKLSRRDPGRIEESRRGVRSRPSAAVRQEKPRLRRTASYPAAAAPPPPPGPDATGSCDPPLPLGLCVAGADRSSPSLVSGLVRRWQVISSRRAGPLLSWR